MRTFVSLNKANRRSFFVRMAIAGFSFCMGQLLFSQEADTLKKYREDQFYLGVVYSTSLGLPQNTYQNGLSYGVHAGFIRDIPLNKACNRAIGIGVGYATVSNYSDLLAEKNAEGAIVYSRIDRDRIYTRNKIETHAIEFPLEFRWRTSTYETNDFWRIYLGVKAAYLFSATSKLVARQAGGFSFDNPDINKWRYSAYIAFNFKGKWNIFAEYTLNNVFNSNARFSPSGSPINIRILNIGIRFYIL